MFLNTRKPVSEALLFHLFRYSEHHRADTDPVMAALLTPAAADTFICRVCQSVILLQRLRLFAAQKAIINPENLRNIQIRRTWQAITATVTRDLI